MTHFASKWIFLVEQNATGYLGQVEPSSGGGAPLASIFDEVDKFYFPQANLSPMILLPLMVAAVVKNLSWAPDATLLFP